ncbi:MAG: FG-GAP-like repeat-containing protein [Candidatus Diapherotrites archaeon]
MNYRTIKTVFILFFLLLSINILASTVPPTVTFVWPVSGTYISGHRSFDFNVLQSDDSNVAFSLWLSASAGSMTNAIMLNKDLNNSNYCFNPDTNGGTTNQCKFIDTIFNGIDLNISTSSYADGNYFFDLNAYTDDDFNSFSSSQSFMIDNTVPNVATISIDSGAAETTNSTLSLELSCSDAASGCSEMQFSCSNTPTWVNDTNLSIGTGAGEGFIGDVDGDGNNDITVVNASENIIQLYIWNGSTWTNDNNLGTNNTPRAVFVADANNDGDNDIIVANVNSNQIPVHQRDGGTWTSDLNLTAVDSPQEVFVGDADNDGDNDIIIADVYEPYNITVFLWDGSTWNRDFILGAGNYPSEVFIGDADNDGDNDIVVANFNDDTIGIYLWNGSEWDNDYNIGTGDGTEPSSVIVGDADNDSLNEILVSYRSVLAVTVIEWNGSTFVMDNNIGIISATYRIALGDLDEDGDNDILAPGYVGDYVSVIHWDGSTWVTDSNFGTQDRPEAAFIGDADNDGDNDFIVSHLYVNSVSVFQWDPGYTNLETYNSSKSFDLNTVGVDCNSEIGSHTVYVKFKDRAGNTVVANDSINIVAAQPDVNIIWPVSGTYVSGKRSIDFNVRVDGGEDLNASIYLIQGATVYTLYSDVNLESTAYCSDPDANNETTNQCSFTNAILNSLDLNIDTTLYSDNNYTIQIDINGFNGGSNTETSPSFMIDNTIPGTATISIDSGAETTSSTSLDLTLSCSDAGSTCSEMQFSCSNNERWVNDVNLGTQTSPYSTMIGDVDNDGNNDIVVANRGSSTVSVFQWNGSTWINDNNLGVVDTPIGVAIGDADNDGDNDIAVTNLNTDNVSLFQWTGSTWVNDYNIAVQDQPLYIHIEDADNDGDNDIIVGNYRDQTTSVLQWNGTTWINDYNLGTPNRVYSTFVADADNDGDNDIITAVRTSKLISIWIWNGSDWSNDFNLATSADAYNVFVGDVDNDGDNDIVAVNTSPVASTASVHLWNGTGWNNDYNLATQNNPYIAHIGDVDNDGNNDIVFTNGSSNTASVHLWNGTGWNNDYNLATQTTPHSVFIGDADNDGDNDIVVANWGSDTLSVFQWNTTYTALENYSTSQTIDLSTAGADCNTDFGTKTIYVKYKDRAGKTITASDTIDYIANPDVNITWPVSGTYVSGKRSIDFNVRVDGGSDLNASIYLIQGATVYTLYSDVNLESTAYCSDPDANNETTNQCSFTNSAFNGIDLNIDTNIYSDANYTIRVDINAIGGSDTETSPSFMIDNTTLNGTNLIDGGNAYTTSRNLTLTLSCADAGSECDQMQFSCSNNKTWVSDLNLGTQDRPEDLAIGDVDNDGDNDFVVVHTYINSISVFQWNGTDWDNDYNLGTNAGPSDVMIADVNGDGLNDIIVSNTGDVEDSADDNVTVFLWNGTNWSADYNLGTKDQPKGIAVGDVDNDGDNDIIAANFGTSVVSVFQWNGTSWLNDYNLSIGVYGTGAFIADADNDGDNDIIITNATTSGTASIHKWNGAGWDAEIIIGAQNTPIGIFVGDADNDEENELIIANLNSASIGVYNWTGSTWTSDYNIAVKSNPISVFVGDPDNDLNNEIVVGYAGTNNVTTVIEWDGSNWNTDYNLGTADEPYDAIVGDVDNDGDNDILATGYVGDYITVLEWNENEIFTSFETYSTSKSIDLGSDADCNANYGAKPVYAQFKDRAGNKIIVSDTIEYGVEPTIEVTYPTEAGTYVSNNKLNVDSNSDINFTVRDAEGTGDTLFADVYYSSTAGEFETQLFNDLNLNDPNQVFYSCPDIDWSTNQRCSIDFNVAGISDGNYFIDVNIYDSHDINKTDSSNNSFYIDNIKPVTVADYNAIWQNFDANVLFTITEASGNYLTQYRLDSNADTGTTYGNWTDYNKTASNCTGTATACSSFVEEGTCNGQAICSWAKGNCSGIATECSEMPTASCEAQDGCSLSTTAAITSVLFQSDGNYAIDFNSLDAANNLEDTNTIYILIDSTAPTTTSDANTGWQNRDANVKLTCSDSVANTQSIGCNITKYRVDTDSSNAVSYGAWQTYDSNVFFNTDGNWAIDFNSNDSLGNQETVNTEYILLSKTNPVVAISNPTSGQVLSIGTTQIDVNYTGTAAEVSIDHYEVRITGGAWINNSTNLGYSFTGLQNGQSYTVDVNVSDTAGNDSMSSVSFSVDISTGSTNFCSDYGGSTCAPPNECSESLFTTTDTTYCCVGECTQEIIEKEIDLTVLDFSVINSATGTPFFLENDEVKFNAIIKNNGTKDVNGNIEVMFSDQQGYLNHTETVQGLASQEQKNISFSIIFDSETYAWNGSELFTAEVDPSNSIAESNETNNSDTSLAAFGSIPNILFSEKPYLTDLIYTEGKLESAVLHVSFTAETESVGNPFRVTVYGKTQALWQDTIHKLNKGEIISLQYNFDASQFGYQDLFKIWLDSEKEILESNEADNLEIVYIKQENADLVFKEGNTPIYAMQNQKITLRGKIVNEGKKQTGQFETEIYFDGNLVKTLSSTGLDAGKEIEFTYDLNGVSSLSEHNARIVLDSSKQVNELFELNNEFEWEINIISEENRIYSYNEILNNENLLATAFRADSGQNYAFRINSNLLQQIRRINDTRWGESTAFIYELSGLTNQNSYLLEATEADMPYASYEFNLMNLYSDCERYVDVAYREHLVETILKWINSQFYPSQENPAFLSRMHYLRTNNIIFRNTEIMNRSSDNPFCYAVMRTRGTEDSSGTTNQTNNSQAVSGGNTPNNQTIPLEEQT